jgi:D-alanine-D-alanine ligase
MTREKLIEELKKKRVGVLMGGLSEEREISLKSGRAVQKALLSLGYNAVAIDVDKDVAATLRQEGVEVVFIALHGLCGEDGVVQGLLEIMQLPYTGSGVLASAVAMDKAASKIVFIQRKVPTPCFELLRDGDTELPADLNLPLIVKPACQGSTIGIGLAETPQEFAEMAREAYRYGDTLVVESFISGREITISVIDGRALPIVEIVTKSRIYDFKSKYEKGMTEFIVPAKLDPEVEGAANEAALMAYKALGCEGVARVDILLDPSGNPFVLEANTVPGMTGMSLLPMAAKAAGMDYERLVEVLLLGATLHKEGKSAEEVKENA